MKTHQTPALGLKGWIASATSGSAVLVVHYMYIFVMCDVIASSGKTALVILTSFA